MLITHDSWRFFPQYFLTLSQISKQVEKLYKPVWWPSVLLYKFDVLRAEFVEQFQVFLSNDEEVITKELHTQVCQTTRIV